MNGCRCNTPKPGANDGPREGAGGGFRDAQGTAAKTKKVEEDDQGYDDYGRKKRTKTTKVHE